MKKVIIVGGSFAGYSVAVNLRQKDKDSSITLISEEAYRPYDRQRLIDFLAGSVKEEELFLCAENFYTENSINFLGGKKATALNLKKKAVFLKEKGCLEYDFLVIASGRKAVLPDIPGAKKDGVFTIDSLDDCKGFLRYLVTDTVCLAGSDECALSLAKAIAGKYGVEVKLVSRNIFNPLPDAPQVEIINSQLMEIIGEGQAQAVRLKEGKVIGISAVIFKEEFKSNIDFIKDTPLKTENGIIAVDQNMRTDIENIFACGAVCGRIDLSDIAADGAIIAENIAAL